MRRVLELRSEKAAELNRGPRDLATVSQLSPTNATAQSIRELSPGESMTQPGNMPYSLSH